MSIERREHVRTAIRHEVAYDYYSYDGQKLGRGYGVTVNISAGGLMFDTDKPLEASMKLLVEIISPMYMFMARGHIVYSFQVEEHHYRAGVKLEEVIQGSWELMAETVSDERR